MAEWQIKRNEEQFTAPDLDTLQQWAQQGRVARSDYVFNPTLQRWMYASELAELKGKWHASTSNKGGCAATIALGLMALMFFIYNVQVLGFAFLLGSVAALVYTVVTERRD